MNFIKTTMAAAAFVPLAGMATANTVNICGAGSSPGPFDVATGDTFLCELVFSGLSATNGSVILDFESSQVPAIAAAASANLGGIGSSFDSATLEWFDKPSNVSLGFTALSDLAGIGFGGSLSTVFDGPAIDEQFVVLSWTGFSSNSGILQVSIQVDGEVNPVPIPAAGLMLLTALGGIGFARRFKKV